MTTESDPRIRISGFLRRHLVGPLRGETELVERDSPVFQYTVGILFPRDTSTDLVLQEDHVDEGGGSAQDALADDPVTLANQRLPASFGLSLVIRGTDSIECAVRAAVYDGEGSAWRRRPLPADKPDERVVLTAGEPDQPCLERRARLRSRWRRHADGWLVTVALVNDAAASGKPLYEVADCLFQVALEIRPMNGAIGAYPTVAIRASQEDEELATQYRSRLVHAIGHGCAADWGNYNADGTPSVARIDFLPAVDVPPVEGRDDNDDCLVLARLADPSWTEMVPALRTFAGRYADWITEQGDAAKALPVDERPAAGRIVSRLEDAAARIAYGIDLLEKHDEARRAFHVANLAMLMQMRHGASDLGGGERSIDEPVDFPTKPDYLAATQYRWRPFQLAFLLLTIRSLFEEDSPERDLVDLIWFPTGGGKTEAYLAVAAMEIALRRMRLGERGGGTAVVSRYTLRLLTSQQFRRTSTLACALEALRADGCAELAGDQISVGLWIGEGTPYTCADASDRYEELLEEPNPESPFQLDACPWCGTALVPAARADDSDLYGFISTNVEFRFRCVRRDCRFGQRLPVQIVDSMIYQEPPTILIGTVDKFARLAWLENAGAILGDDLHAPPSLIIQDEMHLLGGPLGTIFGVYETAIDVACRLRGGRPKIVASTATIRDTDRQSLGLFGSLARVFPPPGLDAANSFYARINPDKPGRMYLGVLSAHHTPTTTLIRISALLAQAALEVPLDEDEADGFWTQIVYHNSLRELGHFLTQARDDVPAWIRIVANDEANMRGIRDDDVMELSSNVSRLGTPRLLARLERRRGTTDSVSIAASTNMFSVGVDVQRLALMLVNGQPKTTSEYIQATSRVGRGDVPGLVVTHLSGLRPRDRSHYEGFRGFHQALYRQVEPTSVSPFALPSRLRALHAALVIVVRHGLGLSADAAAVNFDASDPRVVEAISLLATRASLADPAEADAITAQLAGLATEWSRQARSGLPLYYTTQSTLPRLLKNFDERGGGWETLQSLRNVDRQCEIEVVGTTPPPPKPPRRRRS